YSRFKLDCDGRRDFQNAFGKIREPITCQNADDAYGERLRLDFPSNPKTRWAKALQHSYMPRKLDDRGVHTRQSNERADHNRDHEDHAIERLEGRSSLRENYRKIAREYYAQLRNPIVDLSGYLDLLGGIMHLHENHRRQTRLVQRALQRRDGNLQ